MDLPATSTRTADALLRVRGVVQGVGFRPFVHRLAAAESLRGWVLNDAGGVLVRVCGEEHRVERFARKLSEESPPAAKVEEVERLQVSPDTREPGSGFAILESVATALSIGTAVPADLALCDACRRELLSPSDRRRGYPFVNCTQCGPRYSIIEGLPYDRPRTTMRAFRLCEDCAREYADPQSRRYHAEPNACPACGPRLVFLGSDGECRARGNKSVGLAARALAAGYIVAVKGVGGFHLFCDAGDEKAVAELRRRKRRDEKPFAVMLADLAQVRRETLLNERAERALRSPEAPIVLLPRAPTSSVVAGVAPGNPWLGILLPYAPLHVLLLNETRLPLVATSANLSEEPLCTDEGEALRRLNGIADFFLSHDREIAHPVDDSVLRFDGAGLPVFLRKARGYAPSSFALPESLPDTVLCVGAQLKATVALAREKRVVLSPHVGDLENLPTQQAFEKNIATLSQLAGSRYDRIACDKHPGYVSTEFAQRSGLPLFPVQHHLAHLLACLLEHRQRPDDVLGLVWDGTGYGEDGAIWGGEFLLARKGRVSRFGHLRPFGLPGGDVAVRDARRAAYSLLLEGGSDEALLRALELGFTETEAATLAKMLERGLNSVRCTSLGRLFDATAVFLGLGLRNTYEAQLPLAVEALAQKAVGRERAWALPFPLERCERTGHWVADWQPALTELDDSSSGPASRAHALHRGLAELAVAAARQAEVRSVALCGGCFQNTLLLDLCRKALANDGFEVLRPLQLPPGDGAIAVGQAFGALLGLGTVESP